MSADQNGRRAPPAFQQYAADRLADRNYRAMSAVERGVLHAMELEAWVAITLPSSLNELARVLSLEGSEVEAGLTERVLRHFERRDDDNGQQVFVCPELDAYRDRLLERHARMSAGGKQSAEAINRRRKKPVQDSQPDSQPDTLSASHPDSPLSRAEQSRTEQSRAEQSVFMRDESTSGDTWIDEYDGPSPFEEEAARRRGRVKPGIRG